MTSVLCVVLGLSALMDLALGVWASAAWGSFTETWRLQSFQVSAQATADARLLGTVLGFCLLMFAALQVQIILWIRRGWEQGHRLTVIFGAYLLISSVVTSLLFHRPEFLWVDGLRGILLGALALLSLNTPATVRELRLPARTHVTPRMRDHRGAEDRSAVRHGDRRGRRRDNRADRDRDRSRSRVAGRHGHSGGRAGGRTTDRESTAERGTDGDRERLAARGENRSSRIRGDRSPDPRSRAREVMPVGPERPKPPRREPVSEQDDRDLTVVVHGPADKHRPHDERPPLQAGGLPLAGREAASPLSQEASLSPAAGDFEQREDDASPRGDRRRRRRRGPRRNGEAREYAAPIEDGSFMDLPEPAAAEDSDDRDPPPSSGYVQALDKLSLLEPRPAGTKGDSSPFGRTRKPAGRRR